MAEGTDWSPEEIRRQLAEENEEALLCDGLDEGLIGTAYRFGMAGQVALYDIDKCIEVFMNRDGMTEDEAREWMDFNVLGAWMGEGTPMFCHTYRR